MPPRRSARLAASCCLNDADTESLAASAVCEARNALESTRHMEHVPCCNFFAHRDCGEEAIHVFSCCPRALFHVRCSATMISIDSSEVRCPACSASLCDSASLDWFTRLCHINGVELPMQSDLGEYMLCWEDVDVESSVRARCFTTRGQLCPLPSLSTRGLRVFRRLRCFTGA